MAALWHTRYLLAVTMVMFYSRPLNADPNLTFSFENFGEDPNYESQLALLGDAEVSNESKSVQISGSGDSKGGIVICKIPISLVAGNSPRIVSFSNYFVFSMSRENGNGFAFFMLPSRFPSNFSDVGSMEMLLERKAKFLAVKFNSSKDESYGDFNGNHVGLDVENPISVKVSSGEKLRAWIDYESSGQNVEVTLSKYGDNQPDNPLLYHRFDLSTMWKEGPVLLGFSSSSGNSSQKINIYTWSFKARILSHLLHSGPLNPSDFVGAEELKTRKKSDCASRILAALILGTGCGALGALLVLFVGTLVSDRRPVVPEDFDIEAKKLEFKKVDVSEDKTPSKMASNDYDFAV